MLLLLLLLLLLLVLLLLLLLLLHHHLQHLHLTLLVVLEEHALLAHAFELVLNLLRRLPVVVLAAVVQSVLPERRRERVRGGDSVLV